jgi:hypothetical protein
VTAPTVLVLTLTLDELRRLVVAAVVEALAAQVVAARSTLALVDRRELARLFNVSAATVTRLTAEGMPCTYVGDSSRYSPDEVRAWLDERGRRGTKAKPSMGPIAGVRLLSRGGRGGR